MDMIISVITTLLYILAPVIAAGYKALDYWGVLDKYTGRTKAVKGLERLKSTAGFPVNTLFDDNEDRDVFDPLYTRIAQKTKSDKIKAALLEGHRPSLIGTVGQPIAIEGVPPDWGLEERFFYSQNHPVLFFFGVNRQGGQGKGDKVCTLAELDKWLDQEKKDREFWVGVVVVTLLSTASVLFRLQLS
jgi:hypothetical protein